MAHKGCVPVHQPKLSIVAFSSVSVAIKRHKTTEKSISSTGSDVSIGFCMALGQCFMSMSYSIYALTNSTMHVSVHNLSLVYRRSISNHNHMVQLIIMAEEFWSKNHDTIAKF